MGKQLLWYGEKLNSCRPGKGEGRSDHIRGAVKKEDRGVIGRLVWKFQGSRGGKLKVRRRKDVGEGVVFSA